MASRCWPVAVLLALLCDEPAFASPGRAELLRPLSGKTPRVLRR